MSATCNFLVRGPAGRLGECAQPAQWRWKLLNYCETHARGVARTIPLKSIDDPDAVLDLREPKRNLRYYRYPRP